MIDFGLRVFSHLSVTEEDFELLAQYTKTIQEDLSNLKENKYFLGVHLLDLWTSSSYRVAFKDVSMQELRDSGISIPIGAGNCCSALFFKYCEDQFDLEKSQVTRYMNIVSEFSNGNLSGFAEEWSGFSYAALIELLPLSEEERKKVEPDWTCKMIREYKKSLKNKPESPPKEEPKIEELEDEAETPEQNPEYERFKNWTKIQLYDRILQLEEELRTQFQQLQELEADVNKNPIGRLSYV